ncbi:hypothetical protein [Natrinema versiforme]|uniref:Uncharacterized protein n=1 Tax=Natrinema versiforme TaxID=88724 RepID=A0A4V1FYF8_9EURY|nr:hypothetical protein [Natrinema versiforme]QCS41309.1 hypothetical protein FEJ81_02695 [Natrinema versiforme]
MDFGSVREVREFAQRSGKDPEEIAIEEIEAWRAVLYTLRDDTRKMNDEEFEEFLEEYRT